MTSTINSFHYQYEDVLDEFIEASFVPLGEYIARGSKWRPSVPLLVFGGVCGGVLAMLSHSVSGKLFSLLVPIAIVLLLTISSKQTRIEGARRQMELRLRENYAEKKCHVHDFSMDDSGVVETCPCGTEIRKWQAFKRWQETERMFVLQSLNKQLYALPKRVIPPEELQPLREFLSQHIQPLDSTAG